MEQAEKIMLWKGNLIARKVGFAAFSHAMTNSWENPCISHMVKYAIGWNLMEKKYSYFGEGMVTNAGPPNSMDFAAFSYAMGNRWGNPFISLVMNYAIGWEFNGKKHPYYRKVWTPISQVIPIQWVLLQFFHAMGNWSGNPCISNVIKYTTRWESNGKKYSYYGKSMVINFSGFPYSTSFENFLHFLKILNIHPSRYSTSKVSLYLRKYCLLLLPE